MRKSARTRLRLIPSRNAYLVEGLALEEGVERALPLLVVQGLEELPDGGRDFAAAATAVVTAVTAGEAGAGGGRRGGGGEGGGTRRQQTAAHARTRRRHRVEFLERIIVIK